MIKQANISKCKVYRYSLSRSWGYGRSVAFIGLNPSTADAIDDDRTITRCINYAKSWDYSKLWMINLFAFRATKPENMMKSIDPNGPHNDEMINIVIKDVSLIIAAWGTKGSFLNRDHEIKNMVKNLHYLKLTKDGFPSHPLYLKKDLTPKLWSY